MHYKIDTIPIWDAFRAKDCGCPICALHSKLEAAQVSLYLDEAVMEPLYRVEVNKRGFCPGHFKQLLAGRNKLGLALQTLTRSEQLAKTLPLNPGNAKAAAKAAKKIRESLSGCVICGSIKASMEQYLETVVKMFENERDFPAAVEKSAGFCLPHYADLLEHAHCAGKRAQEFLAAANGAFTRNFTQIMNDTESFTNKFDASKNGGAAPTLTPAEAAALPKLIDKICGK